MNDCPMTLPRRLYHGTTTAHLDSILRQGLLPRGASGVDTSGRYQGRQAHLESVEGHVYLSHRSALAHASRWADSETQPAVVEFDASTLDLRRIYPDEDNVATRVLSEWRGTEHRFQRATAEELARAHNVARESIDAYQFAWPESIWRFGRVAHRGPISPDAITRASVVPLSAVDLETLRSLVYDVQRRHPHSTIVGISELERTVMSRLNDWAFGASMSAERLVEGTGTFLVKEERRKVQAMLRRKPSFASAGRAPSGAYVC